MKLLPVALNLEGKRVLVVGGGPVAQRKVRACVECGAVVRVIAPEMCECFALLAGQFEHLPRAYQTGDGAGFALVFAATNRRAVNAVVQAEARERGAWCSIADAPEKSDLHGAATVRRGEIAVGITTGGGSPALARHLKERIQSVIGPEYEELLTMLASRRAGMERDDEQSVRAERWRAVLGSDVLDLLRAGRSEDAERLLNEILGAD